MDPDNEGGIATSLHIDPFLTCDLDMSVLPVQDKVQTDPSFLKCQRSTTSSLKMEREAVQFIPADEIEREAVKVVRKRSATSFRCLQEAEFHFPQPAVGNFPYAYRAPLRIGEQ